MNRIVCAANLVNDHIVCGIRHYDNIMHEHIKLINESFSSANVIQGFVDKNRVFHNRRDSWKIARDAKQIFRLVGGQDDFNAEDEELYSENLY